MFHTPSKIIFIDLDHTLLDNLDIRLKAARKALSILFPEPLIEPALLTYSAIIDHTYAFEALGFPSFSHYWNPLEIYAILALLAPDNNFINEHPEFLNANSKTLWADLFAAERMVQSSNRSGFFSDEDFHKACLEMLDDDNKERLNAFASMARKIVSDKIFQEAQRAYNINIELKPLGPALRFLRRLQENEFLFYLVSEGLTHVQLEKVSQLGLQDLFNGRALITQAAAEPVEMEEIAGAAKEMASAPGRLIADDQRRLDYLTLCYFNGLMKKWSDKSNKQFYSRVLHAVQLDPVSPQDRLRNVETLSRDEWLARPPIKLAMIGDRYDKDLLPVLKLCGKENSITIRIQQGKYKDVPHPQQADSWRSPTATFEEFSQVEEFIFDPHNWEAIAPVPWPKIFDEPPSVQSAIYIERANKLAMPSVRKLAKILENEQASIE